MGCLLVALFFLWGGEKKPPPPVFLGRLKAGGANSIALYGSGELAEIALLSLQEVGLDLAGVVSARGAGESLCGRPVGRPESLRSLVYDQVVVIEPDRAQLETTLTRCGVDASNVFWVEL